jgi:hypothetical protein
MQTQFDTPMAYEVTDLRRHSYNAAFYELGLRWHWDEATFRELMAIEDCEARVLHYMRQHQPHMLAAYDCGFLCRAIEEARMGALQNLTGNGQNPQHAAQFDWTEFQRATVGI